MTIIDFERERARRRNGQFGVQPNTSAEVSLPVKDTPPGQAAITSAIEKSVRSPNGRVHVSLKDTNVVIRRVLAETFPGVKFSVVGDSYAGGASTNISWVDGPDEGEVKEATYRFAGATFDGMTDLKSYVDDLQDDGTEVSWGPDYVFTRREYSPDVKDVAEASVVYSLSVEGKEYDPNTLYTCPPGALFSAAHKSQHRYRMSGEMWGASLVALAQQLEANRRFYGQP